MKALRIIALIALIAIPSSAFAWSRGGAVAVRGGFPSRAVVVGPGFPSRAVVVGPGFPSRAVVVGPGFANRAVFVRPGFPGSVAFVRPGFANRVLFVNGFPRRVAFVRPFFPARFVGPAFFGGLATGLVLNPFFLPRSFYFPGPLAYYYPPSSVFASGDYPPSYSYDVAPPPPAQPPTDAYDRGYSEG